MEYKLYCNNGLFRHKGSDKDVTFITTVDVFDEDTIHTHLPIPKGGLITMENIVQNLYGTFIQTTWNGKEYNIKPKYLIKVGE